MELTGICCFRPVPLFPHCFLIYTFRMIKTILPVLRCLLAGRVIGRQEYRNGYDSASPTYGAWLGIMAKHTEKIVRPEDLEPVAASSRPIRILDLSCGTGYITGRILRLVPSGQVRITGVDISGEMIGRYRQSFSSSGVTAVTADGFEFVRERENNAFDIVYCGWALPYYKPRKLIREIGRILVPGGIAGFISNEKGTLAGIQEAYMETMGNHAGQVRNIDTIYRRLPKDRTAMNGWFRNAGFTVLDSGQGEETVSFSRGNDLLEWLRKTGAVAGSEKIFADPEAVEADLISRIEGHTRTGSGFRVNHKFAYGIYRKG